MNIRIPFKRVVFAAVGIVGFGFWYWFGFSGIHHATADPYGSRRAELLKLAIDPDKLYPVERVIDGDTTVFNVEGKDVTVRYLGINAPETVKPKSPVECYGHEASEEDKSLLEGHMARLNVDPKADKVDKYARLLAYIYRDDGLFVNEYLVENGYAREYTFNLKKPYSMQKEFRAAETKAKDGKKGLWGRCAISP